MVERKKIRMAETTSFCLPKPHRPLPKRVGIKSGAAAVTQSTMRAGEPCIHTAAAAADAAAAGKLSGGGVR